MNWTSLQFTVRAGFPAIPGPGESPGQGLLRSTAAMCVDRPTQLRVAVQGTGKCVTALNYGMVNKTMAQRITEALRLLRELAWGGG